MLSGREWLIGTIKSAYNYIFYLFIEPLLQNILIDT